MISEGSWDTEEIMLKIQLCVTGINYILKYIKIETFYFKLQWYLTIILWNNIQYFYYKIDRLQPWWA